MPTYEYRCDECGHELEIEQRISEPKLEICPACQKAKLVRLISGSSFILKGGGWYADLYHKPAGSSGSAGSSSSGSSTSGSSSPAPSAPAAAPASAPASTPKGGSGTS